MRAYGAHATLALLNSGREAAHPGSICSTMWAVETVGGRSCVFTRVTLTTDHAPASSSLLVSAAVRAVQSLCLLYTSPSPRD